MGPRINVMFSWKAMMIFASLTYPMSQGYPSTVSRVESNANVSDNNACITLFDELSITVNCSRLSRESRQQAVRAAASSTSCIDEARQVVRQQKLDQIEFAIDVLQTVGDAEDIELLLEFADRADIDKALKVRIINAVETMLCIGWPDPRCNSEASLDLSSERTLSSQFRSIRDKHSKIDRQIRSEIATDIIDRCVGKLIELRKAGEVNASETESAWNGIQLFCDWLFFANDDSKTILLVRRYLEQLVVLAEVPNASADAQKMDAKLLFQALYRLQEAIGPIQGLRVLFDGNVNRTDILCVCKSLLNNLDQATQVNPLGLKVASLERYGYLVGGVASSQQFIIEMRRALISDDPVVVVGAAGVLREHGISSYAMPLPAVQNAYIVKTIHVPQYSVTDLLRSMAIRDLAVHSLKP